MASTGTPALSSSATLGMRVNLECRATTTSLKVCGGALWCTIHQSGGSSAKGYGPPLFSYLLDRRVQNRQTLRYLKSPSYQNTRTSARDAYTCWTGVMQDAGYELLRTPILRSWVNKASVRALGFPGWHYGFGSLVKKEEDYEPWRLRRPWQPGPWPTPAVPTRRELPGR